VVVLFGIYSASPQKHNDTSQSGISLPKRYIFIDGGTHLGETIAHFEKSKLYSRYPWEIFSFEANPNLIGDIPKRKNMTILNKAIWTHDGTIEFYLAEETLSSSILENKKTGGLSKTPTRVDSVDFGQWLKRNFSKDDYIFVKFDIEGAEYDVLDKMLSDGSIAYVDKLYIEFHNVKVDVPVEPDGELLTAIKKMGVDVKATPHAPSEEGDYFKDADSWFSNIRRIIGP